MTWEPCDAGERLRDSLKTYIQKWIRQPDYVGRIPREHIHVLKQGELQPSGLIVVVVSEADPSATWPYTLAHGADNGRTVVEESHRIAIVIKSDKQSGGTVSASSMQSVLRSIFSCLEGEPERDELISLGIYNLFENPDGGIEVEPEKDDEEGTRYQIVIDLVCTTDRFNK